MDYMEYFARPDQKLEHHLRNVLELGKSRYHSELCQFINYYHDIGKSRKTWQEYLSNSVKQTELGLPRPARISHAKQSADYVFQYFKNNDLNKLSNIYYKLAIMLIESHHTKKLILRFTVEKDYTLVYSGDNSIDDSYLQNNFHLINNCCDFGNKKIREIDKLVVKYLFSCLIDSDITDCQNSIGLTIPKFPSFKEIEYDFFKKYNYKFTNSEGLNFYRREIFDSCVTSGQSPDVGIYSLNVPTGGGKTLSSLAFALKKAAATNCEKIIYVLPFNTLVNQTTDVFREYFPEYTFDVHSQTDFMVGEKSEEYMKTSKDQKEYISETFNGKIIVTTHVAFLEAVFGDNYRRFRHLVDSVIVMDEVQAFGLKNTKLVIDACLHLKQYGTSTIISTATQLDYHKIFENDKYVSTVPIIDILGGKNYDSYFDRVDFKYIKGEQTYSDLIKYCHPTNSTLIITNTREQAYKLFYEFKSCGLNVLHMSKNMTREHLHETLDSVKTKLNCGEKFILVTTNLIEAGVDVDFHRIIRFTAGIPNIVQSAGRCNRSMKRKKEDSIVYICDCELDDEKGLRSVSPQFREDCVLTSSFFNFSDSQINIKDMLEYDKNKFSNSKIQEIINMKCYDDYRDKLLDTTEKFGLETYGPDLFKKYHAIDENGNVSIVSSIRYLKMINSGHFDIGSLMEFSVDVPKSKACLFTKIEEYDFCIFEEHQYNYETGLDIYNNSKQLFIV